MRHDGGLKFGEGTISQRGDSWQARWVETSSKGKVVRRGRTFATRDAAEDHLRSMHRAKRDGRYVPPSELTVREVIEGFLLRGAPRWRPSTYAAYHDRAKTHIYPEFGSLRAETLTTPRIQHWIDAMIRAKYSPSLIDGVVLVLRAALKEAVNIGILTRNPVTGVRYPRVEMAQTEIWTAEQIKKVTQAIDDPMWLAYHRLALATGMRPGEMRGLQWRDIDFNASTITISRTVTRDAEGHVIIGTTTKTGRSRVNAISLAEVKILTIWRTEQKIRQLACPKWHKLDLVFERGDGRMLDTMRIKRTFEAICERAGVPYVVAHASRHANATVSLVEGQNPLIVSKRLGHSSVVMTLDRYSHVTAAVNREAADSLSRSIFGDEEMLPAAASRDAH